MYRDHRIFTGMTSSTTSLRRLVGGCVLAAALLTAAPAGASTYDNGSDGSTGTSVDNPTTDGGTGGTGTVGGDTTPDGATPTTQAPGAGGTGGDDLGNVDDGELAFTGSDALSLAAIGGALLGAGALMVTASRRREDHDDE